MKFVMINSDRNTDKPTRADYFDRDFNWLDFTWGYSHAGGSAPETRNNLRNGCNCRTAFKGTSAHSRWIYMIAMGKIYFGELTFFDGSGV